jgi:hypothetical protein
MVWLGKSEELVEEAALKDRWQTGRIDIAKRKGSQESILQEWTILPTTQRSRID